MRAPASADGSIRRGLLALGLGRASLPVLLGLVDQDAAEAMMGKGRSWVMPVGRHQGELITRMPVSYLKWMVCAKHEYAKEAQAELDRRGTVTPDLDVSGHAINRASRRCLNIWLEGTKHTGEGLHAWLVRLASEALKKGARKGPNRYHWQGLLFVFEMDGTWPVLLTVMPKKAPS